MSMFSRRLASPPITSARAVDMRPRGDFIDWLAASGGTLAVTTYNSGKLALLSAPRGELSASFWSFPRPMGLASDGNRLALASRDLLWQFDVTRADDSATSAPRWLIEPTIVHATGRLDAHDVAFDRRGPVFANTRFNCVARPSERVHFRRVWRPSFLDGDSSLGTDCCHLNGIGVHERRLRMATAFCDQGTPAAWRAIDRFQAGVLIDVLHDRVVARGLSLPHSPRWHAGRWWLCDSGRGALVTFEPSRQACAPAIELPGFTRGLAFAGQRAIVGLSRIRPRHILDAPPVRERWPKLRSGLALVDYARGVETGSLEFIRGGREVYDVAFLAGVTAAAFRLTEAN
ncbi:TIGR03032 family protein [Lacipirellula limnantheis]|nr:TIGR03032 family protein [Lacipirellula limnantheis]